jgi:raffinose/stachyose/melibiose transport system substrate-binding protein
MTFGDEGAQMGNGLAAMELMGQWAPGNQETNSESGEGVTENLGWFPFPAVEGARAILRTSWVAVTALPSA